MFAAPQEEDDLAWTVTDCRNEEPEKTKTRIARVKLGPSKRPTVTLIDESVECSTGAESEALDLEPPLLRPGRRRKIRRCLIPCKYGDTCFYGDACHFSHDSRVDATRVKPFEKPHSLYENLNVNIIRFGLELWRPPREPMRMASSNGNKNRT